jgi:hypothetical protein
MKFGPRPLPKLAQDFHPNDAKGSPGKAIRRSTEPVIRASAIRSKTALEEV